MKSEALREKLHEFIDSADEQKLQVIYSFLEEELSSYSYHKNDINLFHERRENYLKGEDMPYTVRASFDDIRNVNK